MTPKTAHPPETRLPRALGWASLALGVPQVAAPDAFDRFIGVKPDAKSRAWTLAVGARELAAAAGLLATRRRVPFAWARVAGDAKDVALLVNARGRKRADHTRLTAATAAVAGIAALDLYTAIRTSRAPERTTADLDVKVKAAVTVHRPRDEVYAFWRDLERLPSFMAHLEQVSVVDERRSRWTAKAPIGTVEWEAELVEDRPNELLAWRSAEGARVHNAGTVRFADAPGDRGTEILVELDYQAPGGKAGAMAAKLFGEDPEQQVKDDIRRAKQILETGEVVRSDSTPEGQAAKRYLKQRPAQPVEEVAAR